MFFVVVVGKEYGIGFLRDWVVKGIFLLGVWVVIVELFERIYCLNLIGMGVFFFEFFKGIDCKILKLDGFEIILFMGFVKGLKLCVKV